MATRAFAKWGIDFVGPIDPPTMQTYTQYIITTIDYVTKWVEIKATQKNDSYTTISGGTTTITTSGSCKMDTTYVTSESFMVDTTSCAGIKCDSVFTMTAGSLTILSTGDGGKGINCSQNIEVSGGTLLVETEGGNNESKPKAVKSDTGIILSGGSFTARTDKSWACDNGYDSDTETDAQIAQKRVTIIGTPQTQSLSKKEVIVVF